eukprot:6599547-Prymnesium_polylepis.1
MCRSKDVRDLQGGCGANGNGLQLRRYSRWRNAPTRVAKAVYSCSRARSQSAGCGEKHPTDAALEIKSTSCRQASNDLRRIRRMSSRQHQYLWCIALKP